MTLNKLGKNLINLIDKYDTPIFEPIKNGKLNPRQYKQMKEHLVRKKNKVPMKLPKQKPTIDLDKPTIDIDITPILPNINDGLVVVDNGEIKFEKQINEPKGLAYLLGVSDE
jgi:hypothetical protein|tara:strand:+ start:59 stop:394 length:336 start_codon:yes stop_codon:yes gene_type:complete